MKGPYQIKRTVETVSPKLGMYHFELVHEPTQQVLKVTRSNSPIAPRDLLRRQAQLNTNALLAHPVW